MGCGAWRAGPVRTTRRRLSRSNGPSISGVTSSTRHGPTATDVANGSSGIWSVTIPIETLYVATKVPPRNRKWPSQRGFTLDECFPPEYIKEYAEKSLQNLQLTHIDLLQFHVWEDAWAHDERWQRAMEDLKRQALVRAVGVSVNRWEPANVLETLRTGMIDAVQVIYNIFDQSPEDELFPLCRELNVGVIARVPFDEGTLTGTLTREINLA